MTSARSARHRFLPRKSRRVPAVIAGALAIVGALLITLAACSSRSGPPQPSAAAAGSINPVASAVASTSAPSSSTASSTAAPTTTTATKTTAAAKSTTKSTPAKTTTPAKATTPSKTAPIVPPSFANAAKGLVLSASTPVSLSIPSLNVKSSLLQLGLNPDGTVQVPSLDDPDSKAGWYKNSPTPGSVGPAIILGHIDSKKYGPGVFYELGNLKPGDEVDVTRQDGSVAVFKISGVRSYPKDNFPTHTVYGNLNYAGLRLITCGGTFDPDKGSYESNIVAYASLVSSH